MNTLRKGSRLEGRKQEQGSKKHDELLKKGEEKRSDKVVDHRKNVCLHCSGNGMNNIGGRSIYTAPPEQA